ncbi:MAG TPA: prepilin-type N-terminal cleavage/methylation domain-containing protein [Actinomycetota bacterium]|nr:prepilin-type N-terminal cleavage/methylation domain-containing protein [Actinomycetota bacterium]
MRRRQDGFTLIELLVVIIVIAILAAIAIPVFIRQREKAYVAQIQSALKNASTAVEAYATDNGGDYSGLDTIADLPGTMRANGFRVPEWATAFDVVATSSHYCIQIRHTRATAATGWRRATYFSARGVPEPSPDVCPAASAL